MMPLAFASAGQKVLVTKIGGNQEVKKHLEDLGFVVGTEVQVINDTGDGNIIINLKESRLAITKEMATKIMVQ